MHSARRRASVHRSENWLSSKKWVEKKLIPSPSLGTWGERDTGPTSVRRLDDRSTGSYNGCIGLDEMRMWGDDRREDKCERVETLEAGG